VRAAARIADDPDILVVGSQAILGSFAEADASNVMIWRLRNSLRCARRIWRLSPRYSTPISST